MATKNLSAGTAGTHTASAPLELVTVPRCPDLPFLTRTTTKRGRVVSWCDFDVPAEEYTQGFLTGTRVCAALFKRMCDGPPCDLVMVAQGAAAALAEKGDQPSRRGAGAGFFRALEALVKHAAATNTISHSRTVVDQAVFSAERAATRWADEKAAKAAKASTPRARRSRSAATAGAAQ